MLPASVLKVCQHIKQYGGRAWLVGGALRDILRKKTIADIDLEVFGLDFSALHHALSKLGRCECVGRHFGVIKLQYEGHTIDVALPRKEQKVATGHRGFTVIPDPQLTPEQATLRRDFTINAMMWQPLSQQWLDIHGGEQDLRQGVLRHVSPAFAEDPLRVLRAMQLAARYALYLHADTAALCRTMLAEASSLPPSRLWHEWHKWSLSSSPRHGLQCLADSGWLQCYPDLEAMQGCMQDKQWHPEGDVWQHTGLVVNQLARIASERHLADNERSMLCFAALLHDVGKPLTSFTDDHGRIRSPNHAQAAKPLLQRFFHAIGAPSRLCQPVWHLVNDHLTHLHNSTPTPRAIRRLTARLAPVTLEQWEILVEADASGRAPHPAARPAYAWLTQAQAMRLHKQRPTPWVTGRMLIDLGIKPSPSMGKIIRQAYDAQLDGAFDSQNGAEAWCRDVGIIINRTTIDDRSNNK